MSTQRPRQPWLHDLRIIVDGNATALSASTGDVSPGAGHGFFVDEWSIPRRPSAWAPAIAGTSSRRSDAANSPSPLTDLQCAGSKTFTAPSPVVNATIGQLEPDLEVWRAAAKSPVGKREKTPRGDRSRDPAAAGTGQASWSIGFATRPRACATRTALVRLPTPSLR